MLKRLTTLFGLAVMAAACTEATVPNLNDPTLPESGIIANPSRAQLGQIAAGVLIASRTDHAALIRDFEILGRDAYNLDNADPRWVSEWLIGPLDPGGNFGGAHWRFEYRAIRTTNTLIGSVLTADTTAIFTGDEVRATLGFARTMKALNLLAVWQSRGALGIARDAAPTSEALEPIVCSAPALAYIEALLDSAETNLAAGGSSFPFDLPAGFSGFDDPASFLEFNRGLAAKVDIYQQDYTGALGNLALSFIDMTGAATLARGVYYDYSTQPNDLPNPLVTGNTTFRAHPSVIADAEPGDRRVATKVDTTTGEELVYADDPAVRSKYVFIAYDGLNAPIPILRNEELILMRAEADIGVNNLGVALGDINYIRVQSGGLAPVPFFVSEVAALTELLKQKRYSLLWESGSRWVDARLYGRLATLPLDNTTHVVHPQLPIPEDEALARSNNTTCTP